VHPAIYESVLDWIPSGARVLDLGTGDGAFLERLVRAKRVAAEGVEKDPRLVARCIQRGLVAHQGNIAEGLDQYGDRTFDYALLLGTFQELISPEEIVREAFRVAQRVIIAYSNFAHYRVRLDILLRGRTPVTQSLPQLWYRTTNLHFFSTLDFAEFCRQMGVSGVRHAYVGSHGKVRLLPNLFAEEVVTLLESDRQPRAASGGSGGIASGAAAGFIP
jgi:methionine biosynthesis protein MetW